MEKIERLSKLHDLIKQNKFRENNEIYLNYARGYYDNLYSLLDTFIEIKKTDKMGQLSKLDNCLFYHDFMAAITSSRNAAYWLLRDEYDGVIGKIKNKDFDWQTIKDNEIEIENGLSCIHRFIETQRFDTFFAWKNGAYLRFEWNEDTQEYEPKHIVKTSSEEIRTYLIENNIFPTLTDMF